MLYALLVSQNEAEVRALASTGLPARAGASGRFAAVAYRSGTERGDQGLPPSATATTARTRGGETRTTAGPFAPMGRPPVGFWVVEAASAEEVAWLAARIPAAARGGIEARPARATPDGSPVWEESGLLSGQADRFQ